MRITLFTEVFLPKIDGVVTRVTKTVDQLVELGHEVQIIAPANAPATYAGFEVVRAPSLSFRPVYPEIKIGFPSLRVERAITRFNPDVIHAVNPVWLAGYGVLMAKRRDVPLIASFHTNVPEYTSELGIGFIRPVAQGAINWLHNQAEINLCTSAPMVDKARGLGMRNVKLWPKAVDTVTYHPSKRDQAMRARLTGGHPEDPLIIYVGRMSKEKNIDRLPGIMAQVRRRIPTARLAMIGSGPYLEGITARLDPSFTTFTGFMTGEDLAQAFASADVFAFPSLTETLGLVTLEGFASGIPAVGSRAGGIPFVISEGRTGYLVDPDGSDAEWADKLCAILSDATLRSTMAHAARKEAERFSWRAATETVVGYYEQTIERFNGAHHA